MVFAGQLGTGESSETMMPFHRQAHQPLNPSVRPLLDPEYVAFHEEHLQYIPTLESSPWSPSVRKPNTPLSSTEPQPVAVGRIKDIWMADARYQIRAYSPVGYSQRNGWPVLIWLHGGEVALDCCAYRDCSLHISYIRAW